jgi:hypothetical protein
MTVDIPAHLPRGSIADIVAQSHQLSNSRPSAAYPSPWRLLRGRLSIDNCALLHAMHVSFVGGNLAGSALCRSARYGIQDGRAESGGN